MAKGGELVGPGRVAVVTGAASGIGFALSERFANEGMRVVMADVEGPALVGAAEELARRGADVLPVLTDVSNAAQVDALRDEALATYGPVDVVCNNAGVGGPHDPVWTIAQADWDWVLGVNLHGVLNGIRSFVPLLVDQGHGHVVNTASIFGVFAGSLGPYGVSKHGVVALSEVLYFQLQELSAPIGVSVLCPGAVRTRFGDSGRNRPKSAGPVPEPGLAEAASMEKMGQLLEGGKDPAEVAGLVVDAIRSGRFYVLTSTSRDGAVRRRAEEILSGGPPTPPMT